MYATPLFRFTNCLPFVHLLLLFILLYCVCVCVSTNIVFSSALLESKETIIHDLVLFEKHCQIICRIFFNHDYIWAVHFGQKYCKRDVATSFLKYIY